MRENTASVWDSDSVGNTDADLVAVAHSMLTARRALHGPLPSNFLHDPALGLLLTLFIADDTDSVTTIGSLCTAATIPSPVMRRWIMAVAAEGMIATSADDMDGIVSLTAKGKRDVASALYAVLASQRGLGAAR
jgi:predicted transcriptional regulator